MGMNRIRRKDLKRRRDPLEGKKPEEIDWAAREARARAQMDKSRARTLSGEDYAAKAPSTYRRGGRRDPGAIS